MLAPSFGILEIIIILFVLGVGVVFVCLIVWLLVYVLSKNKTAGSDVGAILSRLELLEQRVREMEMQKESRPDSEDM
jgi:hypothetical protein